MISGESHLNPNGCGIGLTVSKKYIEHLGGNIFIDSQYEIGTQIEFTIPLDLPETENIEVLEQDEMINPNFENMDEDWYFSERSAFDTIHNLDNYEFDLQLKK